MQITRKNFFIGSVAATAAIGLKAAEQKPLSNIQGFKWTSGITKTLLIAYHLPFHITLLLLNKYSRKSSCNLFCSYSIVDQCVNIKRIILQP